MHVSDFDWDKANWPKCGKHGVSREEIEALFTTDAAVYPATAGRELRRIAIGRAAAGHWLLVVFTFRHRQGGQRLIRPISARYMHKEEVEHYEKRKNT